jgi:hypothetical protein
LFVCLSVCLFVCLFVCSIVCISYWQSFQGFKATLSLHEKDDRFQSLQARQLLCAPYFLFVLHLVDEQAVISECPVKLV